MDSQKQQKNKSESTRIPIYQKNYIKKIGNGNFRHGLAKLINTFEIVNRDPSILLLKELEHFSGMIKAFSPENHFDHYLKSNLPAVMRKFVMTGVVDGAILNGRVEKPIENFNKNQEEK